jgi:hypothetical protein
MAAQPLFDVEFGPGSLGMYLVSSRAGHGLVVEKFGSDGSGIPLAAEKTGQIAIGDAIVAINGGSIRGMPKSDALRVLTESHRPVAITFLQEGGLADIERLSLRARLDLALGKGGGGGGVSTPLGMLEVTVVRGGDIGLAKGVSCAPTVTLRYRDQTHRTRPQSSAHPEYGEAFDFQIYDGLVGSTIEIEVENSVLDRSQPNARFLGRSVLPLSDLKPAQVTERVCQLADKPGMPASTRHRGQIELALRWVPSSSVVEAAAVAFTGKHSGEQHTGQQQGAYDQDDHGSTIHNVTHNATGQSGYGTTDAAGGYGATDYTVDTPAPVAAKQQDQQDDQQDSRPLGKAHDKLSQAHQLISKAHETIATLEGELMSSRAAEAGSRARVEMLEEGQDASSAMEAMGRELEQKGAQAMQLQRDLQQGERRAVELGAAADRAHRESQELRLENDTLRGEGRMQKQLLVELQHKCARLEEDHQEGSRRTEQASASWQAKEEAMRDELERLRREGVQMSAAAARRDEEAHAMKTALRRAQEEAQEEARAQIDAMTQQQRQQLDDTMQQARQAEERAQERQRQLESKQASNSAQASEMLRLREGHDARGHEVETLTRKCSMYEEQLVAVQDEALSSGLQSEQQHAIVTKMAQQVKDLHRHTHTALAVHSLHTHPHTHYTLTTHSSHTHYTHYTLTTHTHTR